MINTYIVLSIFAGLFAALFAYGLNSMTNRIFGDKAIIFGAPVFEELLKTGLALFLDCSILGSHISFGVVEAVYDFYKNRGLLGILSALVGLLSHSIFGLITIYAYKIGKTPVLGISLAILSHILWNYGIMNIRLRQ